MSDCATVISIATGPTSTTAGCGTELTPVSLLDSFYWDLVSSYL